MSLDLSQKQLDPNTPQNQEVLRQLQNNILSPHGRDVNYQIFITFKKGEAEAVKKWLKTLPITSALHQYNSSQKRRQQNNADFNGGPVLTAGFSREGLEYLGAKPPQGTSFLHGMPASGPCLGDPQVGEWEPSYQNIIHFYMQVADDHESNVATLWDSLYKPAQGFIEKFHVEKGRVLYNQQGQVIDHYELVDGISQPLWLTSDIEKYAKKQGLSVGRIEEWKYDPRTPLNQALLPDPNVEDSNCYGSYGVFRKLNMNSEAYSQNIENLKAKLDENKEDPALARELAIAYTVGRFKNGTPAINHGKPLPSSGKMPDNNFDFYPDPYSAKCPFFSHIRSVNPRSDVTTTPPKPRLVRRSTSYGESSSNDKGLLFLCFQGSIANQFEHLQIVWANNTNFVISNTGIDVLAGQTILAENPRACFGDSTRNRDHQRAKPENSNYPNCYPRRYGIDAASDQMLCDNPKAFVGFDFGRTVTMEGGVYLFFPSLTFFTNL